MTAHGAALGAARKATKPATPRGGSPAAEAELARQLCRLAQLEDPANTSPTAIAYQEMLSAAKPPTRGDSTHPGRAS